MAAVQLGPHLHLDQRSFFFALSADQSEFLFPGDSKGWLSLRMLSLGFGARDEVHVLEAEGTQGGGENAKMVAQKTAMLGVQPSLPTVTLPSTVLTPPVTFRLRSGPGPLYVSGSHLLVLEEEGQGAPALSIPKAYEEPAQESANVSSETYIDPLFANALQTFKSPTIAAKDGALENSETKNARRKKKVYKKSKTASNKKEQSKSNPDERGYNMLKHLDKFRDKVKAKILESMAKGVKLSDVKFRFERFLKHCHKVTDPYVVEELWEWRKSLGF